MHSIKPNKKPPITEKTLRHPGQSLDEKLDKLDYEDIINFLFFLYNFRHGVLYGNYKSPC